MIAQLPGRLEVRLARLSGSQATNTPFTSIWNGRSQGPTRCRSQPTCRSVASAANPGLEAERSPAPSRVVPPTTAQPPPDHVVTLFRWPGQLPGSHVGVTGSFNNWGPPLPLSRMPNGDWVRSVALPPGPIEFKFTIDGHYKASPCETIVRNGASFNNQRQVTATCELAWPSSALGGREVMVAGDWSAWGELLPLTADPVTGSHRLSVCLPPGTYAYQFLVDGDWRLRPDADAAHTPDGHFANIIQVHLPPAFRIYYATGWKDAVLRVRGLDHRGQPMTDAWQEVPLHDTASRSHVKDSGRRWKMAVVGASGGAAPASLEFVPAAADGTAEDRPHGGGAYMCPRPGGYKLRSGRLHPFAQAGSPPAMLVSDLDGTMVGEGPEADAMTSEFGAYWEESAALVGSVLVYNTGRSLGQFQGLLESKAGALPVPDVLITAVGTKIFLLNREGGTRGTSSGLSWQEDQQWGALLDRDWNLAAVREVGTEAIAGAEEGAAHWLDDGSEHPHRIALSVKATAVPGILAALEAGTASRGLRVKLIVSGNGEWRYVDCVSAHAGKLAALEYVRALFGVAVNRCVAAGDSGNDALMLGGQNPAIVVGNAQEELVRWVLTQPQDGRLVVADAPMAHGVLEGLARLGLY